MPLYWQPQPAGHPHDYCLLQGGSPLEAVTARIWDLNLVWRRLNGKQTPLAVSLSKLKERCRDKRQN